MEFFQYSVKTPQGAIRRGSMRGQSPRDVKNKLKSMRFKVLSIKKMKTGSMELQDREMPESGGKMGVSTPILGSFITQDGAGKIHVSLFAEKINDKDLIVFTKQLGTMLKSGVPLVQAMTILQRQQKKAKFRAVISRIQGMVENGRSFSDALKAFPQTFPQLYSSLVFSGETSGQLPEVLANIVIYLEKSLKIRNEISSKSSQPIFTLVVGLLLAVGILTFIVPALAAQFKEAGKELPALTQIVMNCSDFLLTYWYLILIAMFLSVWGLRSWLATPKGQRQFDALSLKIPVIGDLVLKITIGRFCSTLASMIGSGVNLLDALTICASTAGNTVIKEFVLKVRKQLEQGSNLASALSRGGIFPDMVVSMVEVGESTGALDEMLKKVSEYYDEEVTQAMDTALSFIQPVSTILIGLVVGIIVVAIYLPIFDLGSTI